MLEQAESLRTGGTSLTLFKNGWKVLDAIGVGNKLRSQFLEIQGYVLMYYQVYICSSILITCVSNCYWIFRTWLTRT